VGKGGGTPPTKRPSGRPSIGRKTRPKKKSYPYREGDRKEKRLVRCRKGEVKTVQFFRTKGGWLRGRECGKDFSQGEGKEGSNRRAKQQKIRYARPPTILNVRKSWREGHEVPTVEEPMIAEFQRPYARA